MNPMERVNEIAKNIPPEKLGEYIRNEQERISKLLQDRQLSQDQEEMKDSNLHSQKQKTD